MGDTGRTNPKSGTDRPITGTEPGQTTGGACRSTTSRSTASTARRRPARLPGQGRAGRERRVQVRAHPAVRGPREAARAVRRPGASRCSAFPCNQFMGQEPGTRRGDRDVLLHHLRRHLPADREDRRQRRRPPPALRRAHRRWPTPRATAGDIQWNFEKFLVAPGGEVVARFRPTVDARGPRARRAPSRPTSPPDPRPRLTRDAAAADADRHRPWTHRVPCVRDRTTSSGRHSDHPRCRA